MDWPTAGAQMFCVPLTETLAAGIRRHVDFGERARWLTERFTGVLPGSVSSAVGHMVSVALNVVRLR